MGAFKSLPGGLSEMVRALVKVLGAASVRLNTAVDAHHRPRPVPRAIVDG